MPNRLIKLYARRSGKSEEAVDGYWNEAKKSAKDAGFSEDDPKFWAYVNVITQKRAGLKEAQTFKEFLKSST